MTETLTISTPQEESPKLFDQDAFVDRPETERQYGIIDVAESYAFAQLRQDYIYATRPSTEWMTAAEATLKRYPQLKPYADIFTAGVQGMVDVKATTAKYWDSFKDSDNQETSRYEGDTEIAGPILSGAIFSDFLRRSLRYSNFKPQDPVEASKGNFLWFNLSKRDFEQFAVEGKLSSGANAMATALLHETDSEVFFSPKDYLHMPKVGVVHHESLDRTLLHEGQHLKSKTYIQAFVEAARMEAQSDDQLLRKLAGERHERFRGEDPAALRFKEELEAYITAHTANYDRPGNDNALYDLLSFVSVRFTPGMAYYNAKSVEQAGGPEVFEEKMKQATQSFLVMRDIQMEKNKLSPGKADLITIKMLRLFPLEQWPAVVSLANAKLQKSNRG